MPLTSMSIPEFLAAVRSPSPTPGGGSASALAGALGASLLAMVGAMPKARTETAEDITRLRAAGARASRLAERLTALVDRDSEAYDAVIAAYRLPKDTADEKAARSARIQEAAAGAASVPLEVMVACRDAAEAAVTVAAFGNTNAASDVGVALELLLAGCRGARLNVEINLPSIKDTAFVEATREAATAAADECAAAVDAARKALPG